MTTAWGPLRAKATNPDSYPRLPLVSSLAVGKLAGSFPVPITIVPGNLTPEEIEGIA